MKFLYIIISSLFIACNEDFLVLAPHSAANVENFYKTEEDFNNAVIAAYASLQSGKQYGGDFGDLMEFRSDNLVLNSFTSGSQDLYNIDHFIETPANNTLDKVWGSVYKTILLCNTVLDKIDGVSFSEGRKTMFRGEVKFIRALSYFNLVRLWGDVPLALSVLSPEEALKLGRNPKSEVYSAIITDLVSASNTNYENLDIGRANEGAAKALLGKVYITLERWAEAKNILKEVIDAGKYRLLDNVLDVFDPAKDYNDEIIFAVRYIKGGLGEGHGLWFNQTSKSDIVIAEELRNAYDTLDSRMQLIKTVRRNGRYLPLKWDDVLSSSLDAGNDFPVLRYADVVLMYAEALNEEGYSADGEAFTYLNKIRNRVSLQSLTATDLPNQEKFRNAIYKERWFEFPMENQRWFDLVRTGKAIETMGQIGISISEHQFIYPIPQSEIERINNSSIFSQNIGY